VVSGEKVQRKSPDPESPGFPEKKSGEKVRILRVFSRRKAQSKISAFGREKGKKAKLDQTTSKNHEI
jgi:hypothetical protein